MIKVLVSACLLGEPVRYNGADALSAHPILDRWREEGRLVPFCPEVAGGLGVPRPAAELVGGDGGAVLDETGRVVDVLGRDVTASFLTGARGALAAAIGSGAKVAILKEGSPSCGSSTVYDGTFSGVRRAGQGVTAALLSQSGIRVFSEAGLEAAARYLAALEADDR